MNDNMVSSTTTSITTTTHNTNPVMNTNANANDSIDVITIDDDDYDYEYDNDDVQCLDDNPNHFNGNDNDIEIIEVKVNTEQIASSNGKTNVIVLNGESPVKPIETSENGKQIDPIKGLNRIEPIDETDITEPIASTSTLNTIPQLNCDLKPIVKPQLKQKYLPDVNDTDLYDNYIKVCRQRMTAINTVEGHNETATEEEISKFSKIVDKLRKDKPKFIESSQYLMLLRVFAHDIIKESDDNRVIRYHNDLMIELNRVSKKVKRNNGERRMSKAMMKKKIDKLTNTLKKLQRVITEAENEVLDYEKMDAPSKFTDLPRLHKKQLQIWRKREELLKRSIKTGRYLFKKFHYNNTDIPVELRQSAENLFNQFLKKLENWNRSGYKDETFTFIDIHSAMIKVIDEHKIVLRDKDAIIKQIYIDLRTELRERSSMETEDDLESLATLDDLKPESIANENDPQIEIELSVNKNVFTRKLNELLVKFAQKDREKNGENLLNSEKEWEQPLLENEDFELIDAKDDDLANEEEESENDVEDGEAMDVDQNQQLSPVKDEINDNNV